jgi:acyl-CoA synthetase (AMP-forming)/AMP-acid ligase II
MDMPELTCIHEYVAFHAQQDPDREALVFEDRRLSWRELNEQIDRTAKAFLELGIEPGDIIALVSMARPAFIISFMAAAKIGAIWLGISPRYTPDEVRWFLGHCRPALLITASRYRDIDLIEQGITFQIEFSSIREVLVIGETQEADLRSFQEYVDQPRAEWDARLEERAAACTPDTEVLLLYTSGSTGRPKGALHTHRNILASVSLEEKRFCWQPDDRILLHFPINHVAADVEIGCTAIHAGATLVLMEHFDADKSLEIIQQEKITAIGQVPAMYLMQMARPGFKAMDWSAVRLLVWGAAQLPEPAFEVLWRIHEEHGVRLMTGYGATELCGFVTYTAGDESRERLLKSAGRVWQPFELRIADADRNPLPPGETGEIAVRGPSIMKGYLNDPALTAQVIDTAGWYYTQDLGRLDEDGYLYIIGRSSEMYKSGGENIFPLEIETVIETHPDVLFAAVIGAPDPVYSETGHAFVTLKPGADTSPEALRQHCRRRLTSFKVPGKIDIRATLPLLANGKVDKMALRQQLGLT